MRNETTHVIIKCCCICCNICIPLWFVICFLYITENESAKRSGRAISRRCGELVFRLCRPCVFLHCTLNILSCCWHSDQYCCYYIIVPKQRKSMCSLVWRSIPVLWKLTRSLTSLGHVKKLGQQCHGKAISKRALQRCILTFALRSQRRQRCQRNLGSELTHGPPYST